MENVLRDAGWQVETCQTGEKNHGITLAREAVQKGCNVVVACGGDGTVNEVANGLARTNVPLGVIPLGTGNAWAREMGLPRRLADAAKVLVEGQVRYVDLGRAGDRCFLLMAGIGFDAEVTRHVPREAKRRWGILAYVASGIWTGLRFAGTPATVTIDGRVTRRRVLMIVLSNTRLYGGFVGLTGKAMVDDGFLDVCIFTGRGLVQKVGHLLKVLVGRHTSAPDVECLRCRSMHVVAREGLPVQVDGDPAGTTPMSFGVWPRGLKVILPHDAPSHLFMYPPEKASLSRADA